MIGGSAHMPFGVGSESIVHLAATTCGKVESVAVFKALNGINAEHGSTEHGVELAENRLSKSHRHSGNHSGDNSADGVALALHLLDELLHLGSLCGIGAAHGVCVDCIAAV